MIGGYLVAGLGLSRLSAGHVLQQVGVERAAGGVLRTFLPVHAAEALGDAGVAAGEAGLVGAHHDVERRPRRTLAEGAEEFSRCSLPVRELVARIPAPRCDHRKNEASGTRGAVLDQRPDSAR